MIALTFFANFTAAEDEKYFSGLFMVTDPTYLKEFQTISADFWSSKGILIVISMIFINFLMRFYSLRMDFNDFDQVLC